MNLTDLRKLSKEETIELINELHEKYSSLPDRVEADHSSDGSNTGLIGVLFCRFQKKFGKKIIDTFLGRVKQCHHFYCDFFDSILDSVKRISKVITERNYEYFISKCEKSNDPFVIASGCLLANYKGNKKTAEKFWTRLEDIQLKIKRVRRWQGWPNVKTIKYPYYRVSNARFVYDLLTDKQKFDTVGKIRYCKNCGKMLPDKTSECPDCSSKEIEEA